MRSAWRAASASWWSCSLSWRRRPPSSTTPRHAPPLPPSRRSLLTLVGHLRHLLHLLSTLKLLGGCPALLRCPDAARRRWWGVFTSLHPSSYNSRQLLYPVEGVPFCCNALMQALPAIGQPHPACPFSEP